MEAQAVTTLEETLKVPKEMLKMLRELQREREEIWIPLLESVIKWSREIDSALTRAAEATRALEEKEPTDVKTLH